VLQCDINTIFCPHYIIYMNRDYEPRQRYTELELTTREKVNNRKLEVVKPTIYHANNPEHWKVFNEELGNLPEELKLMPWESDDPAVIRSEAMDRGILLNKFPSMLVDIAKSKRSAEFWDERPGLLERYVKNYDHPKYTTIFKFPWRTDGRYVIGGSEKVTRETIYSRTIDEDPELITPEDFEKFGELAVGIIGAGVGSSDGDALIELGVRNIKIADGGNTAMHDFSRLPNAGFPRIDMNHGIHWTQRAYEMYPFGNFECIPQNIGDGTNGTYPRDDFLEGLDLVFEVVDNVKEKILSRRAAREKGIPVYMTTDLLLGADMMYQPGSKNAEIFPNWDEEDEAKVLSGKKMTFEEKSDLAAKLVGPRAGYWSAGARRERGNWFQSGASAAASKVLVAYTLRRFVRNQDIPHRKELFLDDY
jgi:hypothetical protein